MTYYLVGRRAGNGLPAAIRVVAEPPFFYTPQGEKREIATWRDGHYAFVAVRGAVQEWVDHERGCRIIARVLPEEFIVELGGHDAAVRAAEEVLAEARASRQEFLDTVASRAKPVRVAEAKKEREGFNAAAKAAKAAKEKADGLPEKSPTT